MTWIDIPHQSDFSIHNLPFGIFSVNGEAPRAGIAIGNQIVDLAAASALGVFDGIDGLSAEVFEEATLNSFIAQGKPVTSAVRLAVQRALCDEGSRLKGADQVLVNQADATMHMPIFVGDYTDFYSSIEHATNVGTMFRDPDKALMPNWRHLPVGYHGRASSIIPGGVPIRRPKGQTLPKDADQPVYGASGRLDFELEMAFVIGKSTELGQSISVADAEDHIFGLVLFNDWSARDIQKWEYVPLGPFLGKSFASSIAPWIVPLEALESFRVAGPEQNPPVLPYLQSGGVRNYDIDLQVGITPAGGEETVVSNSNFKYMYWNMAQQLAHHTVNGCNVNVGDMMASGTISGKEPSSYGSMLELAWAGTKPVPLKDGSTRVFLKDHDTVTMRGSATKVDENGNEIRVGFGEVKTEILPALP